ncbi:MAG: hypothetical protein OXL96_01655 [Candidatus Poribacteria bacterium]|nr:hypothetical protein [Candidatus Poribacteria bacterium]
MQTRSIRQLAKTVSFKFQDWAISLIDGLASNPQKVGDDGIIESEETLFHWKTLLEILSELEEEERATN